MAPEVRPPPIRIADRGGRIEAAFYLLFGIMLVYVVQYHRKIARASQAAAGNAGTGEQQGQPTR